MSQRTLRSVALPVAIAAAACAVAIPAQAALAGGVGQAPSATKAPPAGGGYYGVWIQTSWDVNGKVLPCPVEVPLPPGAPKISCAANTFLKLHRSGRYESNLPVFNANEADTGLFAVIAFGGKAGNAIVFDDYGTNDEPRSYRLTMPKSGKKAPKTMVISASMSTAGGGEMQFKMNFTRYTG
ncbi:MAG: hypothetical protein KGQ95_09275 [Acidobacteria bacterium]|nr:hypothetical protein [Acidobacteriota bacterium]